MGRGDDEISVELVMDSGTASCSSNRMTSRCRAKRSRDIERCRPRASVQEAKLDSGGREQAQGHGLTPAPETGSEPASFSQR